MAGNSYSVARHRDQATKAQKIMIYNQKKLQTYKAIIFIRGVRFQNFALRFGCLKNRGFGSVSVFVNPNRGFGSVLFFVCSVFSSQRTMNGFLCFNTLQR